ncbi:MAG: DUF1801 domain-containing protein, partial [Methanospirillum sp.]
AFIRAAAPEAAESISYRIPTYKYHGSLVHFAAFPKHSSLIVVSRPTVERFLGELEGYHVSGTTIRFTPDHPLPPTLVERIVRARVEENEARAGSDGETPRETRRRTRPAQSHPPAQVDAPDTVAGKASARSGRIGREGREDE